MKKRIILVSAILVLALVCLSACNGYNKQLNAIDTLLKADYSSVKISVSTDMSDIKLNGEFTLTFDKGTTTVDYIYEELNELDVNGNNSDSFKSTQKGTVVVNENNVIVSGSKKVLLNLQQLDFSGLSFKQEFFSNVTATATTFDADVSNPRGFTGNDEFECTNMHVKVEFQQDRLTSIAITYVSSANSNVSVDYFFTK